MPVLFRLWCLLLVACPGGTDVTDNGSASDDRDGDGVVDDDDCSPDNANIFPGAADLCDQLDNDCDGEVDENANLYVVHRDQDGDGYGDPTWTMEACTTEDGWLADDSDCGPSDPTIYPGADEHCDGKDHDCDGETMEDAAVDRSSWWPDNDGDGYGAGDVKLDCELPVGYAGNMDDCNDERADVSPRAPEVCDAEDTDEDCDGLSDDLDDWVAGGSAWYPDLDGDGFGDAAAEPSWSCDAPQDHVAPSEDCDDGDSLVFPGSPEVCNGYDDDCDGTVDNEALDAYTWYADDDGDGYGDDTLISYSCEPLPDTSAQSGDCDDNNNTKHPGADETDCSSSVDMNCDGIAGDVDTDGDGFRACEECDDSDSTVFPGAREWCDGADSDCNGSVDDNALDASQWYADADGDGYGDSASTLDSCLRPVGYVASSGDCDDTARSTYPGAPESCLTAGDDDCNGNANEVGAIACSEWFEDSDNDGFGENSVCRCEGEGDYDNPVGSDCDDADATSFPGGDDICGDSVDQDCSGADAGCTFDDADGNWVGRTDGDRFGVCLGNLGDVDLDGHDDLLVGAPTADGAGGDEGGAFWLDGPVGVDMAASRPEAFWYGEGRSDDAGGTVSWGADFDGDGVTDVLIGAVSNDDIEKNAGRVYLASLSSGTVALATSTLYINGLEPHDHVGSSVQLGGDVDDDGDIDAAIGADGTDTTGGEAGSVYIFDDAWTRGESASRADYILTGNDNDHLSVLADRPGDLDGDGVGDLMIGGYGIEGDAPKSGGIVLFGGPISGNRGVSAADAQIKGEAEDDLAGFCLSLADLNDDGALDLLVGAPGAGSAAGAAYLVLGPLNHGSSLSAADLILTGETADDAFGTAVSAADVTGGGTPSIWVGAPGSDRGGADAGAAFRFNGLPSGTIAAADADAAYAGEAAGAEAGTSLLFLNDYDGDGKEDIAVGAPGYTDGSGLVPGGVYVL